jgi:hypothetical protein
MSPGPWVQSGRVFSAEEIAAIRATVAWLPGLARRELVATLGACRTLVGTGLDHKSAHPRQAANRVR